jgi:hypothetical protein
MLISAPSAAPYQFTAHGYFTKSVMISNRELAVDPAAPEGELPSGVECALTYVHYVL